MDSKKGLLLSIIAKDKGVKLIKNKVKGNLVTFQTI